MAEAKAVKEAEEAERVQADRDGMDARATKRARDKDARIEERRRRRRLRRRLRLTRILT